MKKRIDTVLFIIVGTILSMLAFVGCLYILNFILQHTTILIILFIITIISMIILNGSPCF